MKTLYFFLLSFLFFLTANAQIVNIPDANFKAKLLAANSGSGTASNGTPDSSGNVPVYGKIDTNNDGEIQVSEALAIKFLNFTSQSPSEILSIEGISSFSNLQTLRCGNNQLSTLDVSSLTNLRFLSCGSNNLTSLTVSGLLNLRELNCFQNDLTSLNLSNLPNLKELVCAANALTSLDITGFPALIDISCYNNDLTTLNLQGLPNLVGLFCYNNELTELAVNQLPNLKLLNCRVNQLTTLDVDNLQSMTTLICSENQLTTLFIKNHNAAWTSLDFNANTDLEYICCDEEDITLVQNKVLQYQIQNCQVNSYCNFSPGGVFYTIHGSKKLDGDLNGCDAADLSYPNLKFNITNGTVTGSLISNTSGDYSIDVSAGTYTITPQLENPSYFTASPNTATINFPIAESPFTQSFCIVPNGAHHDLEVVAIPLATPRPGFGIQYKLKYKNKGNLSENAILTFNYNEGSLDFYNASLPVTTQTDGTLSWNLGTLVPFQSGEIVLTFGVNGPADTPPVVGGDILNFTTTLVGLTADETPDDNTAALTQTVVNSFDPNDKTCLEGEILGTEKIGKYVHYKIRFENTGTAPAQNIVVKDIIDMAKFDVSSLQITDTSHPCVARITNPDKVEFIFENINLPFEDATNDGYVVFKVKILPTLTVSSFISNSANIYFDYNFPILTNTATSTFQELNVSDIDLDNNFTFYPNPVKDVVHFSVKQAMQIHSINIYNLLGQQVETIINPGNSIDVSALHTGNYVMKIITDKGISVKKFIKE